MKKKCAQLTRIRYKKGQKVTAGGETYTFMGGETGKKKPPAKQPSLDAIYRRVLKLHTTILNQMALIRLDIAEERRTNHLQISHELNSLSAMVDAIRRKFDLESQGQAHLRVTCRTLADHCARLLKEKETLQKRLETLALADHPLFNTVDSDEPSYDFAGANLFMSTKHVPLNELHDFSFNCPTCHGRCKYLERDK